MKPGEHFCCGFGTQRLLDQRVITGLFDLSSYELLNMVLPVGEYTFYFAVDAPDGEATGPWWAIDSVRVSVE